MMLDIKTLTVFIMTVIIKVRQILGCASSIAQHLANNGYDLEVATTRLNEGKPNFYAFARPFIANPTWSNG
ncbi:hypothetical protein GJV26_23335 [Massilia dura]|uniref:Uncharacterized protein n=1 Tax=Pseudoduganella dura TaxID=321982 RepID=A0A6I3XFY8_9BURK|nr:hypothetical protein [Pseudoduganella dura]